MLRTMEGRFGLVPTTATYTMVVKACENAANWMLALQLVQEMQVRGLGPSADAYAAALNACYAGGQYERAEQLKVRPLIASVDCVR